MWTIDPSETFAIFDKQDSGCVSYGVWRDGVRWFVKVAESEPGRTSLRRAIEFHAHVHHQAVVAPVDAFDAGDAVQLVYPWHDGSVLNAATVTGSDRSALLAFQRLPVDDVIAAIETILDAHVAVADAGFVAVDLYDGCFFYDFERAAMRLIDLDEYRPGPFVVEGERLPGSTRYMAPEEFVRGATIDECTTVFNLGRTIEHLLSGPDGWRGIAEQQQIAEWATRTIREERPKTTRELTREWERAC